MGFLTKPKKTLDAGTPVVQAESNRKPTMGELPMSKPTSCFKIEEYTFTIKGRKGNADKTVTERTLYFQDDPFVVEYKPLATIKNMKEKYIKELGLKEIAELAESGYDEKVTSIVMKEKGYKELVQVCIDNKIPILDLCKLVKEQVDGWEVKTRGRKAGEGKGTKSNPLVSILAGLAPTVPPSELAEKLKEMVADEALVSQAIKFLEEKEQENERDEKGYIRLRIRNSK